jgi:hypothetical protein
MPMGIPSQTQDVLLLQNQSDADLQTEHDFRGFSPGLWLQQAFRDGANPDSLRDAERSKKIPQVDCDIWKRL